MTKAPEGMQRVCTIGINQCSSGFHMFVEFDDDRHEDYVGPHRDTQDEAEHDVFIAKKAWEQISGEEGCTIPTFTVN